MDEKLRIKIEHEISRIEKQITDAKPLLDLCKIKDEYPERKPLEVIDNTGTYELYEKEE